MKDSENICYVDSHEGVKCPKCGCTAIIINAEFEFECAWCTHCWQGEDKD